MNNINNTIEIYKSLLGELLNSESYLIKDLNNDYKKKNINSKHNVKGVYIIIDENSNFIYVGKTRNKTIVDRVGNQHVYGGASSDLRDMLGRPPVEKILGYKCKYIEINDDKERSRLENFAIAIINPDLNK